MKKELQIKKVIVRRKLNVLIQRLKKAIKNDRFQQYTIRKQVQLLRRLERYSKQLNAKLSLGLHAALLSTGLLLATNLSAQTFTEQTGSNNPFNGVDLSTAPSFNFIDINNDNDFDLFSGDAFGFAFHYENTGTNTAPVFIERTGVNNPINNTFTAAYLSPFFVDIDNDGDFDCFIGGFQGTIKYYKNTGSNIAPAFTEQTGGNNPFDGVDVGGYASPDFIDIDNDGDFDAFIGEFDGTINYYKNTGTNLAPAFTEQTGANNPFNAVDVGTRSAPAFVDIDNDGDFDAFIGESDGNINYYKNTGTNTLPVFSEQTGANNPFDGVDVGSDSTPAFVDINNNNDFDAFIGENGGTVKYYKNTTSLPVELIFFQGHQNTEGNVLEWQTASEQNNKGFEIQRSPDGSAWKTIDWVAGHGTTLEVQNYTYTDETPFAGNNYYRLKQIDFDGEFEYSDIVNITIEQSDNSNIQFYPNPVRDELNIVTSQATNIQIINITGQVLKEQTIQNNQTINVSDLSSGIYFLKAGQVTKKFILQR